MPPADHRRHPLIRTGFRDGGCHKNHPPDDQRASTARLILSAAFPLLSASLQRLYRRPIAPELGGSLRLNLIQWFGQHALSFTLILAYVPLIATVVTTVVSLILARATLRYTESSDRSLALAREQFEREWAPELHIKLERDIPPRDARIMATNLAKISVLMQMVQLRKLSMAVPSLRYFLNEPLVGSRHT